MLLGFWKHDIIPPVERNLRLGYPSTINKCNDTLQTSFVKHDIYQNIHYKHNQAIYTLPSHLAQAFEELGKLITPLMHAAYKNAELR